MGKHKHKHRSKKCCRVREAPRGLPGLRGPRGLRTETRNRVFSSSFLDPVPKISQEIYVDWKPGQVMEDGPVFSSLLAEVDSETQAILNNGVNFSEITVIQEGTFQLVADLSHANPDETMVHLLILIHNRGDMIVDFIVMSDTQEGEGLQSISNHNYHDVLAGDFFIVAWTPANENLVSSVFSVTEMVSTPTQEIHEISFLVDGPTGDTDLVNIVSLGPTLFPGEETESVVYQFSSSELISTMTFSLIQAGGGGGGSGPVNGGGGGASGKHNSFSDIVPTEAMFPFTIFVGEGGAGGPGGPMSPGGPGISGGLSGVLSNDTSINSSVEGGGGGGNGNGGGEGGFGGGGGGTSSGVNAGGMGIYGSGFPSSGLDGGAGGGLGGSGGGGSGPELGGGGGGGGPGGGNGADAPVSFPGSGAPTTGGGGGGGAPSFSLEFGAIPGAGGKGGSGQVVLLFTL